VILSDSAILAAMELGDIVVDPFDRLRLGGNSYDVRLAPTLLTYHPLEGNTPGPYPMDAMQEHSCFEHQVLRDGFVLVPGVLYLAATLEYTETHQHVPYLDGKSSIGRLGIFIHTTAGRGDVGFCGHWTMEISVVHPVRVYAGMPIGQLTFHSVEGEVLSRYANKPGAKYTQGRMEKPMPLPSMMWKNFQGKP